MGKGKEKCIDPLWPAELYPTAGQGGKVGGRRERGDGGGGFYTGSLHRATGWEVRDRGGRGEIWAGYFTFRIR